MKIKLALVLAVVVLVTLGCAKISNKIARDGGLFTSHAADYIVRNDSGGTIMDVWKLRNVMVQSETSSDGWLFRDNSGNVINIGGDVKVIRCLDSQTWEKYHEYHIEFEEKCYQELYAQVGK